MGKLKLETEGDPVQEVIKFPPECGNVSASKSPHGDTTFPVPCDTGPCLQQPSDKEVWTHHYGAPSGLDTTCLFLRLLPQLLNNPTDTVPVATHMSQAQCLVFNRRVVPGAGHRRDFWCLILILVSFSDNSFSLAPWFNMHQSLILVFSFPRSRYFLRVFVWWKFPHEDTNMKRFSRVIEKDSVWKCHKTQRLSSNTKLLFTLRMRCENVQTATETVSSTQMTIKTDTRGYCWTHTHLLML